MYVPLLSLSVVITSCRKNGRSPHQAHRPFLVLLRELEFRTSSCTQYVNTTASANGLLFNLCAQLIRGVKQFQSRTGGFVSSGVFELAKAEFFKSLLRSVAHSGGKAGQGHARLLVAHLMEILAEKVLIDDRREQAVAAEIFGGVMRGTHRWDYDERVKLWHVRTVHLRLWQSLFCREHSLQTLPLLVPLLIPP